MSITTIILYAMQGREMDYLTKNLMRLIAWMHLFLIALMKN